MLLQLELTPSDAQRLAIALVTHRREMHDTLSSMKIEDIKANDLAGEIMSEMDQFKRLSGEVAEILCQFASERAKRTLCAFEHFGEYHGYTR
jgi:hypothetical protein